MNNLKRDFEEEFDRLFVKQGLPTGIAIYSSKDGTDITPSKLKAFFSSHINKLLGEIEASIQEQRDLLLGGGKATPRELGTGDPFDNALQAQLRGLSTAKEIVGRYKV